MIKILTFGALLATSVIYAASTAGCVSCHGANFEKKALGKSKIVKDMSKEEIIKALKGYKDGSYGGAMKATMTPQVANLSDADIAALADAIKGGGSTKAAPAAQKKEAAPAKDKGLKEDNLESGKVGYDLSGKKVVSEEELGLRKEGLFDEKIKPLDAKFDAPAPGAAKKFARSYVNAPPLIPHSVEGLLPITRKNNACLDCHMPDKAKSVGATPIPESHFTDFRPRTELKDGKIVKDGKVVTNTSDVTIAKFKKLKHLSMARFNCSQCHVPQANVKPLVKNNFRPEFKDESLKAKSNLIEVIDNGVK